MKYSIEQVTVEFVEILGKMNLHSLKDLPRSFLLAVPSRPPRYLPVWQRWQGHPDRGDVGELLHAWTILQRNFNGCMKEGTLNSQ